MEGLHLNPSCEFKKGHRGARTNHVGAIRIRKRRRDGERRAWVKVAEPNLWRLRAALVWELANGPIPKGMLVHHKDRDTLNDALSNLELLSRSQHMKEHHDEILRARWGK